MIAERPVLDLEQLRNITLDDGKLMREVVAALIDDTARQMQALERAIRQGNASECVRLAHYSRGACANVGAGSSAAILHHIERRAAAGDLEGCAASLQALGREIGRLRERAGGI